jgi:hypothetical protein
MQRIIAHLSKIAAALEQKGRTDYADYINQVSASLDVDASLDKSAQELVAAEEVYIQEAVDACDDANRDITAATQIIEAARKRKKKWVQAIGLKKGRLTKYKKPGESMEEAARRALQSDNPSVRGMGSFFLATRKFKKKKKDASEIESAELPQTKHRPAAVFPHDHPKVKDDKDHFPIPDANHGRNALARANQYSEAPEWYDGSLEDLKKTVADKVKEKFPSIEVTEESYK